jgi:hypothetical protein
LDGIHDAIIIAVGNVKLSETPKMWILPQKQRET